jgi:hypothetical protein
MVNFVLLYMGGGGMAATPEEQAAIMQAWGAWFGSLGDALVDGGNPFTPTLRHVAKDGTVSTPSMPGMPTGYSIIKATSIDAAAELAKGCPQLKAGGEIGVCEIMPVM